MANFIAKLGSFDFSDYCRVAPGEGMAPYGQAIGDPIFGAAPSGEGEIVLGEDVKNREHVYPIYFKAASRAALHALIIQFNREIERLKRGDALVHEWRDTSSTSSTFWDVAAARFEPDFNFRQSERGFAAGVIRIWSQPPYGYSPTAPLVHASMAGASMQIATANAASLLGDVPGLLRVQAWGSPTQPCPPDGRAIAVGVLPNASYTPFIPPASMQLYAGAAMVGASGAPASQFIANSNLTILTGAPQPLARFSLQGPIYAGRQRILAAVHPGQISGAAFTLMDANGQGLSPTVVAKGFGNDPYQLVDLGVVSISSAVPTSAFTVYSGYVFDWAVANGTGDYAKFGLRSGTSLYGGALAGIYVMPDDSMALYVDDLAKPVAGAVFMASGGAGIAVGTTGWVDDYNNPLLISPSGGLTVTNNNTFGEGLSIATPNAAGYAVYALSAQRSTNFRARAAISKLSWTNWGATPLLAAVGQYDLNSVLGVFGWHPTFPYLEIQAQQSPFTGAPASTVSRVYLTTPGSWMWRPDEVGVRLEVVSRGDRAWANLMVNHATYWAGSLGVYSSGTTSGATFAPVACVGIQASYIEGIRGYPILTINHGATLIGMMKMSYWSHEALSGPAAPSDNYLLDGITDSVIVTTASSGSFDRTSGLRGRMPQVSPSGARVAVFDSYVSGGAMNDLLTAAVSVRDRFRIAR